MPHPFYPAPTLKELIEHAVKYYGWQKRKSRDRVEHEGKMVTPLYLENRSKEIVTFPPDELDECLAPGQLAHYSRKLAIPLSECQKICVKDEDKDLVR